MKIGTWLAPSCGCWYVSVVCFGVRGRGSVSEGLLLETFVDRHSYQFFLSSARRSNS